MRINEDIDMLDKQEHITINSFLYLKFNEARIEGDRCEIFKNAGFILYSKDQVVFSITGNIDIVKKVDIDEKAGHYYIRLYHNNGIHFDSFYLVTKEKERNLDLKVNDLVVRVDDETALKLHGAYYDNQNIFEEKEEEITRLFLWKVKKIFNNTIVEIEKDNNKRYLSINTITTIEEIKATSLINLKKR